MDSNPPTAADYAWASARDAKEQAKELEARVMRLEDVVISLSIEVARLSDFIGANK